MKKIMIAGQKRMLMIRTMRVTIVVQRRVARACDDSSSEESDDMDN